MHEEVKKVISNAVATNSMSTIDWDSRELIAIPSVENKREQDSFHRNGAPNGGREAVLEKNADPPISSDDCSQNKRPSFSSEPPVREQGERHFQSSRFSDQERYPLPSKSSEREDFYQQSRTSDQDGRYQPSRSSEHESYYHSQKPSDQESYHQPSRYSNHSNRGAGGRGSSSSFGEDRADDGYSYYGSNIVEEERVNYQHTGNRRKKWQPAFAEQDGFSRQDESKFGLQDESYHRRNSDKPVSGLSGDDRYSYYGSGDKEHDTPDGGGDKEAMSMYGGTNAKGSVTESKYGLDSDFIKVPKLSPKEKKPERKEKKKPEKKENDMRGKEKEGRKRKLDGGFETSEDVMAKRANRFSGAGGIKDAHQSALKVDSTQNNNVAKYMGKGLIGGSKKLDEEDYEKMTVKGTCQILEKEYLRLTSPPRAELVRPQHVLEKHLQNLKSEWKTDMRRDYVWFCSQLKAVRQDLTVQRIFNAFSVEVYESHALIALEEGDLNEYNQCQTRLKELYATTRHEKDAPKNENEFVAYRLIYYVFLTGNKKYEEGSSDLFEIMLSLTPEQREDASISHALKVRCAVAEYDYHSFFRLLRSCPKIGASYLMNSMVPTMRLGALRRICKAYRPSIPLKFLLSELGYEYGTDEFYDGKDWIRNCGCVLDVHHENVLTKHSTIRDPDTKVQNSLI